MLKTVGSRSILYVMAADAEYGPHLQARFTPLVCGVGPVESAVNLTRALASERPHIVISLGSAGSRTLEQAEVYEVASVSYRDMDASPLGFEKGRTPFLDLPAELPLTVMGDIPAKRLSTGANIVSGAAYDAIDADMVDGDYGNVVDAVVLWWRDDDGDLVREAREPRVVLVLGGAGLARDAG